jgi:hypothetical protein
MSNKIDLSQLNYEKEYEYFCIKNCIKQILTFCGVHVPIFYINCSLGWQISFSENAKHGYSFQTGTLFSNLILSHEQQIKDYSMKDYDLQSAWENNQLKINQGHPIIVLVDTFYLPYTPYYKTKHSVHSIILCGYTAKTNEFDVIDWYAPWFFKGTVSKTVIEEARLSNISDDGVLGNTCIDFTWFELQDMNWQNDNIVYRQNFKCNLDRFFDSSSEGSITKGNSVLYELCDVLEKNINSNDDKSVSADFLKDFHSQLFFVPYNKNLFKCYIQHLMQYDCDIANYIEIDKIDKNIDEWRTFLSFVIKCMVSLKSEHRVKLLSDFSFLIEREFEFHYYLKQIDEGWR